jgi:hypothetical protein
MVIRYRRFVSSVICAVASCASGFSIADLPADEGAKLPNLIRHSFTHYAMSYENVTLPDGQPRMGLLGVNYLYNLPADLYAGVGGYAAVKGDRGGFFTLGFDAGFHRQLLNNVRLDAGLYLGAGGAHNSHHDEGEGLMLRPHIGLEFEHNGYFYGLSYARLEYPSGTIKSNDVVANFSVPSNLTYADFATLGHTYNKVRLDGYSFPEQQLSLNNQSYFLRSDSSKDATVQLIGIQDRYYFKPQFFTVVSAAGAYKGQDNGYMEAFGGLGWQPKVNLLSGLTWHSSVSLGAGGGGGAVTSGGVLMKVKTGLQYAISPRFAFDVDAGYVQAHKGDFKGYLVDAGLNYRLRFAKYDPAIDEVSPLSVRTRGVTLMAQHITYFSPQFSVANKSGDVGLFGVNLNVFLNKNIYVGGQAASAYAGDAASYATGLLGIGYRYSFTKKWYADTSLQLGAAGGGGIAVHEGAVWQPSVGLGYNLTRDVSLQASVGRLNAFKGDLHTTSLTFGVSRNISLIGAA